jgi:hypothetical protein
MNDRERLARAINALVLVSGQPELDEEYAACTGEDKRASPTTRLVRKTLAELGYVFVGPPVAQRWDN